MTYLAYYCNKESPGKNALLDWIHAKIPQRKISNFTSDWKDGTALACLTDVVSGGQFPDYEDMDPNDPLTNATKTMDFAETLGVPKVITPEQFTDPTLDPISMMTYLTYFQYAIPSGNPLAGISAAGPGIVGDKANKETNFVIRGRIPDWAPLSINITAPNGDKVNFQQMQRVTSSTAIRYTPPIPGNYIIEVLVNKEHIKGSPFTAHHIEPSNAQGCFAKGSGLRKVVVGEKGNFTVDCSNGGAGQLQIEIHAPSGNIGTEVSETSDQVYEVKYTPNEAGPHTITTLWAGNHIDKSPFTVNVIDPKKCIASGSGLTEATVNQPASFKVHTSNAGQGILMVEITGPNGNNISANVREDSRDNYICTYTPSQKGNHTIAILWGDRPISSPFKVVATIPADPSKCSAHNIPTGRLRAGKEVTFLVNTEGAGDGELVASGQGVSLPQKCSTRPIDSSSFEVAFTPFEVGVLDVSVLYAGAPIPKSPFSFTINDPSKCHVNAIAIEKGSYSIKQPVDFRVSAQFAGEGDLTAKLHGPKGEGNVEVRNQGDSTYLVHFVPKEAGPHAIELFFDGDQIPDAPVRLFVNAGSGADDVIVTQPAPGRLGLFVVGTEYEYKINAAGAQDGELAVTGNGIRTGSKPKLDLVKHGDGQYSVNVTTQAPDEYSISISWGGDSVPGSPFHISTVDSSDANKVKVDGPHYHIGQLPVSLVADVGNAGAGELTASCHGKRVGNVPVSVKEKEPQRYSINFEGPQPDIYTLSVLWSNEHIPGSPFKLNLVPPNASKVKVDGPHYKVGQLPVNLSTDVSDAGAGDLTASCNGKKVGNVPVSIEEKEPLLHSVNFEGPQTDIYTLSVLWSGEHIPGSPFEMNLVPHDASKVKVNGPHYQVGQLPVNLVAGVGGAGAGELSASCYGKRVGNVAVSIKEKEPQRHSISFEGPQLDIYTLNVLWSDEHIPGSPFKMNLMPSDASKVIVTKPDHYSLSMRALFKVDATEAGVGDLTAFCRAENSANLPVEISKPDPEFEEYKAVITPIKEVKYFLSIQWGKRDVPGSPFEINLVPVIHSDRVIVEDPVYSMVEQPVVTMVNTSYAGPGKLTAVGIGEKSGGVPVTVKEVEKGKYKLSFVPSLEDDYQLSIFFNDQAVPRSPLFIPIKPIFEPVDQVILTDVESGFGLEAFQDETPAPPNEMYLYIGEPFTIDFDAPLTNDASLDEEQQTGLSVTAIGDKNGPAEVKIKRKDKAKYEIVFNPLKPDRYILNVDYNGSLAPGSPIIVHYSLPVDATKCVITGLEKLSFYPMTTIPLEFGVDATDGGNGELHVTTDRPSGDDTSTVTVDKIEGQKGIYRITYTPTTPGEHSVNLQWGKDRIPGSPLVFNVVSGSAITGESVYPYGKPVVLQLTADCKVKDLDVYAVYEGTNVHTKLKVSKAGKGQFALSFQPDKSGFYDTHAKIKENDVAGSPYRVQYADPPDASKVTVSIVPSDIAYVHTPINFTINVKEAGLGDLVLRSSVRKRARDSRIAPEFKVVNNEDGTFSAEFIPIYHVLHNFDVLFGDSQVPGSPFAIQVIEKPPDISHLLSSDLNLILVNQPVNVYFTLREGESSTLITANATGHSTDDAEVKIQSLQEANDYRAHFIPTNPDDYQLEVMHHGKHIKGSPFPVKVVGMGGFEDTKSLDEVHNPPIIQAKHPVNLLLPIEYNSSTLIDVHIDGPLGVTVTPEVKDDKKSSYAVYFTPREPGEYLVHAKKGEDTLRGSPYRVVVKESRSDASKCYILAEDKPLFEKPQRFGKPCTFRISTANAGPGTLNITSRGPGKADVKIFDNSDGTYTCELSPNIAGRYVVDILWDDQHIDGSPYELNFKQKKKKVITGLDLDMDNFRVGVPHRFKLHCEEIGIGELELICKPSSAAEITVSNLGNQSFQVQILPKEEGRHELSVLYGRNHIFGSPYNVTFHERGDASKCRMISSDVEQVEDGHDHVIFIVSVEGAGKGKLTSHVDNPQSGERQEVNIDSLNDTDFKIHFDLGEGTEYQLVIKYDGEHIEGSPFKLLFADESDGSVCRAEGDGLRVSHVGREASFKVFTEGAGQGELNVLISPVGGTIVEAVVTETNTSEYNVTYTPKMSGDHGISVKWGEQHIPNSPFTAKCYVPAIASNLFVVDPPSDEFLEAPINFKVQRKISGEMKEREVLEILAKSRKEQLNGTVRKQDDGSYTCTIEPQLPAKYEVSITLNGDDITGSPFKVKVSEPPKPDKVLAYGPGLEDGYIGQEGNFTIETDKAGTGTLSVRVHGPKGAFRINMRRHPENDRNILVRYDPKYEGKYTIDVTWSDVHITGSPFPVNIQKQEEDVNGPSEATEDLT